MNNSLKISSLLCLLFLFLTVSLSPLYGQENEDNLLKAEVSHTEQGQQQESTPPSIITKLTVITILALLPFAVMLLTSFIKIIIVLSLLRSALGVQQAPPNQALNGVALLMTIYVMFPTCLAMYSEASDYIQNEAPKELFSSNSAEYIVNVANKTKEPLKKFLIRNMSTSHQASFYQLAYQSAPEGYKKELKKDDFIVIIPSYITSQIKGAFEIGVLIYLPFFVIDLVTSNILLAMGMMMLSPLTIALPLKLLLIVMIDGWTLIIQGLVQTYKI